MFFAAFASCASWRRLDAGAGPAFAYAGIGSSSLACLLASPHIQPANSPLALRLFKSNRNLGLLVAAGFLMDVYVMNDELLSTGTGPAGGSPRKLGADAADVLQPSGRGHRYRIA